MCTCAQNEHMWRRCVLRAGGVQRATCPLRGQKPRHVPRPPAGGSWPHGQAPREPRVPTMRASGRTLPPEALPGLLVGGHGGELDGGAVGTGSRVAIPGTCSGGWGGSGGRRLRREGLRRAPERVRVAVAIGTCASARLGSPPRARSAGHNWDFSAQPPKPRHPVPACTRSQAREGQMGGGHLQPGQV